MRGLYCIPTLLHSVRSERSGQLSQPIMPSCTRQGETATGSRKYLCLSPWCLSPWCLSPWCLSPWCFSPWCLSPWCLSLMPPAFIPPPVASTDQEVPAAAQSAPRSLCTTCLPSPPLHPQSAGPCLLPTLPITRPRPPSPRRTWPPPTTSRRPMPRRQRSPPTYHPPSFTPFHPPPPHFPRRTWLPPMTSHRPKPRPQRSPPTFRTQTLER